MSMHRLWIAAVVMAATLCSAAEIAVVRGDRVNLRAQPVSTSEVLGQVNTGTQLLVRSVRDGWMEVAIPEALDVYAHKDFIQDGVVTASPLNLRAGPGINYSRVGSIPKGTRVAARGALGEWIRLAPPESASAWVSVDWVTFEQPKPVPPPPEEPAFVPTAPPAVSSSRPETQRRPPSAILQGPTAAPVGAPALQPAAAPAAAGLGAGVTLPADLDLAPVARQGAVVVREGRIFSPAFSFRRPSRFQLLTGPANDARMTCYLRGNRAQMMELEGRLLRIQGREFWVRGHDHPVVVIEQITLLEE
ncbi:MAG: SH3 domain-containing protein [Kiritimatiellae bacterium]|nr:SH3 domain-containing protein [Kiritimatiellia bacterium]